MLPVVLLAACADPDAPGKTPGDTGASPPAGDACAPDHALLDLAPRVTRADFVPEWSFTAAQLELWLAASGLSWLGPIRYDIATWRVRYTTQDRGAEVEATALVSAPVVGGQATLGTVLWLHGTSGFEDACAPSVNAVEGLAPALVSAARGYFVVAPDYLGLMAVGDPAPEPHPWIVGEPTGIVALDALRAVDAYLAETASPVRMDRDRIVYWGWSEGGYTALQADRRAPSYAPSYAPVGVVAAVPPVDLRGQVAAGTATFGPASRASAAILYFHARWYGLDGLEAAVQPAVLDAFPGQIDDSCTTWPAIDDATGVEDLYTPEFVAAMAAGADADPWTCVLDRSSIGSPHLPYAGDAPVLLVTASADTLVPAAPVEAAIPGLCDEGYAIAHLACAGLEHGDAPVATLREQVEWLDARMAGAPADGGCGVTAPVVCGG